jgi:hypothetical protein
MAHHVFISYSFGDNIVPDNIVPTLERCKIKCWYAERNVDKTKPYQSQISVAIRESKFLLLVLSGKSITSDYVANEVGIAYDLKKGIMTVRIEDVPPGDNLWLYIKGSTYVDIFGQDFTGGRRVVEEAKKVVHPFPCEYVPSLEIFCTHCDRKEFVEALGAPPWASLKEIVRAKERFENLYRDQSDKWSKNMIKIEKELWPFPHGYVPPLEKFLAFYEKGDYSREECLKVIGLPFWTKSPRMILGAIGRFEEKYRDCRDDWWKL